MGIIRVKHSFNSGDLITLLPGLQHLHKTKGIKFIIYQRLDFEAFYYQGAVSPIKNKEGVQVCMNRDMFDRLKPLIEEQAYIERMEVWQGQQFDWDIDLSRDSKSIPMPAGHIHQWPVSLIPELACDLSKQWIFTEEFPDDYFSYSGKVVVNKTARYNNPYISYFFMKKYEDQLLFAGTEDEYNQFCDEFNLNIEYLRTYDFLHLANILTFCKAFVGCQSFLWHLSDAMKMPRLLELCPSFPNTFITGANGYQAYHQNSFEFYFEQLINS